MKKILFIGAGGHFKDVFNWYLDQTKQQGLKNEIKGIIDDEKIHLEYEPVTKLKIYKFEEIDITNELYFILAIGQISIRKKIISKYQNLNFETCIHPNASISTNCVYKKGNLFGPNVVIAGDCKLGILTILVKIQLLLMIVLLGIIIFFLLHHQLWEIVKSVKIIFLELVQI